MTEQSFSSVGTRVNANENNGFCLDGTRTRSFSQISYSHYGLKLEAEADGFVSSLKAVLRAVLGFLPNSAITI